jgi:hypothetical protein
VAPQTRPFDDAFGGCSPIAWGITKHFDHRKEREEIPMATSLIIEEEQGTYEGFVHQHNGYYAGDFSLLSHPFEPSASTGPS